MSLIDAFQCLRKQRQGAFNRHRAVSPNDGFNRPAAHEFHYHEQVVALLHKVVEHCYVRVIQSGQRDGFGAETFDDLWLAGEFRP